MNGKRVFGLISEQIFAEFAGLEDIVEPAAVRRLTAVEVTIKGGDVASAPGECYKQDQCLEIPELIGAELILQGIEEGF